MKKIVLLTAVLVATASMSYAATPIKNTKHDLSAGSSATVKSLGNTNQICIFCHTPHNAVQAVPLWNRSNPAASGWTMYASPTLTNAATVSTGTFQATSISLFCLSCHDGVTSLGAFTNKGGAADDLLGAMTGNAAINLNGGLANDHPVGFNYVNAATQDGGGLNTRDAANIALGGGAFFGGSADMIECASCHKVHDNTAAPFLRISNTGSNLCLACHAK